MLGVLLSAIAALAWVFHALAGAPIAMVKGVHVTDGRRCCVPEHNLLHEERCIISSARL